MATRLIVPALACLLALLPAAAQAAPRMHVDRRCYAVGDPVKVSGGGFPTNSSVGFTLLGRPYGSAVTDEHGRLQITRDGRAPRIRPSFQRVTLTAQGSGVKVSTHFTITRLDVAISPRRVPDPSRQVTFRARGFDAGRQLYVHYVTPRGAVLRARPLGRVGGPCGTRTVRAPLIPSPSPRAGRWSLRFDTQRRYSGRTRPQVRLTVRVA